MNFHFARKLTALFALWGVLGMSLAWGQTEFHHTRPPVRQPPICPPDCGGGEQYIVTQKTNTVAANAGYQNQATKAQLLAVAAELMAYANQQQTAGNMATVQALFLQYLDYQEQLDASKPYAVAQTFGATDPLSAMQTTWTHIQNGSKYATNIKAAVAYIQSYGMYAFFQQLANTITTYANTLPENYHGHGMILNAPAQAWVDGAVFVGTALMIFGGPFGEAIGGGMLLGAAALTFASDCC
jgi:hypothetical protein